MRPLVGRLAALKRREQCFAAANSLSAASGRLVVADGFDAKAHQRPLIDQNAISKVESLVSGAVSNRAKVIVSGFRSASASLFYKPVLSEVGLDASCL